MGKYAVVYWSGTGNTEAMANVVAEGVKAVGAEVDILKASDFNESAVANYDGIAFGCSAQGAEVLEDSEFQPMWDSVKGALSDKKVVLFGSFGWGGGEFMNIWEEDCGSAGVTVTKTAICQETPDASAEDECKALGKALVG